MRTTITIPDDLVAEARELAGDRTFSALARDAIRQYLIRLRAERMARELEEGYRAEAAAPSLDAAWADVEVEGL